MTNEEEHNMSEAFRTVLISLATAGIIWLIYTTVENKSQINLIDYKLNQIKHNQVELLRAINGKK